MLGFKSPILKFFIGVRPDVAADPRHMKNDPILIQTDSKINVKLLKISEANCVIISCPERLNEIVF